MYPPIYIHLLQPFHPIVERIPPTFGCALENFVSLNLLLVYKVSGNLMKLYFIVNRSKVYPVVLLVLHGVC